MYGPMSLTVGGPFLEQDGRPCFWYYGIGGSHRQIGGQLTSLHLEGRWCGTRTIVDRGLYLEEHQSTVTESDSSPSTTTFIFLLVKKSHSHVLILPSTPLSFILCNSLRWGTVSKALEKSNIIMSICDPCRTPKCENVIRPRKCENF